MRCPHCAGEIPDGSRFCGICGRAIEYDEVGGVISDPVEDAPAPPSRGFGAGMAGKSMSLFDLPPTPAARLTRIIAVVALDLVLIGAGVAMIVSYLNTRNRATAAPRKAEAGAPPAEIEIHDPQPVGPQGRPAAPPQRPDPATPGRPRTPSPPSTEPDPVKPGGELTLPPPIVRAGGAGLTVDAGPVAPPDPGPPDPYADDNELGTQPQVDAGIEAEVSTGSGHAAGPLDDASMEALTRQIALVVRRNESQLQRCYRQVAKGSGQVQGKIVIRFKLQPEGQASGVGVDSNDTGSDRLGQCVAALFQGLALPEHGATEAIEYTWPVVFKAP
jgi:hypothetical protein